MTTLNLKKIYASPISGITKGFPAFHHNMRLDEVGQQRWNILKHDLPFPVALIKESGLKNNIRQMKFFLSDNGVELCPHSKSTMSPQLFERQLNNGAWGLTAATVAHVNVCRSAGVKRIFFANQLVGRENIRYILNELSEDPEFEFFFLTDSVTQIDQIQALLHEFDIKRPLNILIEIGPVGGRCGVRSLEQGLALARHIAEQGELFNLCGIEAFEGSLSGSLDVVSVQVNPFLRKIVELAELCDRENLFRGKYLILTAGGSTFFNRVASVLKEAKLSRTPTILLRSGCYLTHDHGVYADLAYFESNKSTDSYPKFQPALEVWTCIQSIPQPGLAILSLGKRDISYDIKLPIPIYCLQGENFKDLELKEYEITALNDQHAFMRYPPEQEFSVGDLVGLGISHPCTTFDKWQLLFLVDDDYTVLEGIRTFF